MPYWYGRPHHHHHGFGYPRFHHYPYYGGGLYGGGLYGGGLYGSGVHATWSGGAGLGPWWVWALVSGLFVIGLFFFILCLCSQSRRSSVQYVGAAYPQTTAPDPRYETSDDEEEIPADKNKAQESGGQDKDSTPINVPDTGAAGKQASSAPPPKAAETKDASSDAKG